METHGHVYTVGDDQTGHCWDKNCEDEPVKSFVGVHLNAIGSLAVFVLGSSSEKEIDATGGLREGDMTKNLGAGVASSSSSNGEGPNPVIGGGGDISPASTASTVNREPVPALVFTGSADGTVVKWDNETEEEVMRYNSHNGQPVSCLCLTFDGAILFIGCSDSVIMIYEVESGMCTMQIDNCSSVPRTMSCSMSDRTLLCATPKADLIRQIRTGEVDANGSPSENPELRQTSPTLSFRAMSSGNEGNGDDPFEELSLAEENKLRGWEIQQSTPRGGKKRNSRIENAEEDPYLDDYWLPHDGKSKGSPNFTGVNGWKHKDGSTRRSRKRADSTGSHGLEKRDSQRWPVKLTRTSADMKPEDFAYGVSLPALYDPNAEPEELLYVGCDSGFFGVYNIAEEKFQFGLTVELHRYSGIHSIYSTRGGDALITHGQDSAICKWRKIGTMLYWTDKRTNELKFTWNVDTIETEETENTPRNIRKAMEDLGIDAGSPKHADMCETAAVLENSSIEWIWSPDDKTVHPDKAGSPIDANRYSLQHFTCMAGETSRKI